MVSIATGDELDAANAVVRELEQSSNLLRAKVALINRTTNEQVEELQREWMEVFAELPHAVVK